MENIQKLSYLWVNPFFCGSQVVWMDAFRVSQYLFLLAPPLFCGPASPYQVIYGARGPFLQRPKSDQEPDEFKIYQLGPGRIYRKRRASAQYFLA